MTSTLITPAAAGAGVPLEELQDVVRRGMNLAHSAPVQITELHEHSNINYVYRASFGGQTIVLKLIPERPKMLALNLSRRRVFAEAEALRRFRSACGGAVLVPEVLFVDGEAFMLGMSDVGEGRRVLLDVLPGGYALLTESAGALGRGLGQVHDRCRGFQPFRPPEEDRLLRAIVFRGLVGPGAAALFPNIWEQMAAEMDHYRETLVHADLWGKNILVKSGSAPALVDFEGAFLGDAAFDLGTVLAVSLLPAFEVPALFASSASFAEVFLTAWCDVQYDPLWARCACVRAFHYTAAFLAARGFGPFAYRLAQPALERLRTFAEGLARRPPGNLEAYTERLRQPQEDRL
jgi:Ser/Thr protein kinase RdoA (MazF antagonist)